LKILIIRAGALGDTLMLMPSIRGLGKDAEITIAGRRPGIDYLRPHVDRCIDMETSGWHRLFMEGTDYTPPLNHTPDHVTAFVNDPDGRLRDRLKRIFQNSMVKIFPVFPPKEYKGHIALYMAKALQDAGLPIDSERAFEKSLVSPLLRPDICAQVDDGLVVIHPGSGSQRKNYPPAFWLRLITEIKAIQQGKGGRIILLIGPAEESILPVLREGIRERDVEIKVLPEKEELMSILVKGAVYVGHDSGVTHLAAMTGIHVIALFKNSPVEQWRPLGPNVMIIRNGDYSLS